MLFRALGHESVISLLWYMRENPLIYPWLGLKPRFDMRGSL